MADEILLKYTVDTSDFDKASLKIKDVTQLIRQQGQEIKATYADISLTGAIKGMEGLRTSLSKVKEEATQASQQLQNLSPSKQPFDTLVQGTKGAISALQLFSNSAKALGIETDGLDKTIKLVSFSFAALKNAQELATIATKGFKTALSETGIGLAVIVIGELVAHWKDLTGEADKAATSMDTLNSIEEKRAIVLSRAAEGAAGEIARIKELAQAMSDEKLPRSERLKALKDYNEIASSGNRLTADQINQSDIVQKKIQSETNLILARTTVRAAEQELEKEISGALKNEVEARKNLKKAQEEDEKNKSAAAAQAKQEDVTGSSKYLMNQKLQKSDLDVFGAELNLKQAQEKVKTAGKDILDIIKEFQEKYKSLLGETTRNTATTTTETKKTLEKSNDDAVDYAQKFKQIVESRQEDDTAPIITEKTVDNNKENADKMVADLNASLDKYYADKKKKEEDDAANQKALIQNSVSAAKQIVSDIDLVFKTISERQLDNIKQGYDEQNKALDKWHQRALAAAGDNAQKKAAIDRRYSAQKEKLDHQTAIKEAQVKRKQAEIDKAIKIVNIVTQMAENVVKYIGGLPFTAPLLAAAIATGAVELAVVASQPLPPIPKFEKGGPVVLAGGRMNDGHLYGHSHRRGGMLINAQGGEYIWDIPTVQKHGDIIKAAHQNRVEELVLHKYILPLMQNREVKRDMGQVTSEDNFLLRAEVKTGNRLARENAKYIVKGVSDAITSNSYINSRYHS